MKTKDTFLAEVVNHKVSGTLFFIKVQVNSQTLPRKQEKNLRLYSMIRKQHLISVAHPSQKDWVEHFLI